MVNSLDFNLAWNIYFPIIWSLYKDINDVEAIWVKDAKYAPS